MNNQKPVFGLTSSYEKNENVDRIFLNHSYLDTIRQFGGIPLVLSVEGTEEEGNGTAGGSGLRLRRE